MALNLIDTRKAWLSLEMNRLKDGRRYSHFDPIVSLDKIRRELIFSQKEVAAHSFFPLIKSVKEERRRKVDDKSGLRFLNKKERLICYAAHIDSMIYSWYAHVLNVSYDQYLVSNRLESSALAYRRLNKTTLDFVKEVGDFIKQKGVCVVLCFDVKDFFGTIRHSELRNNWIRVISLHEKIHDNRMPEDHFKIFERVSAYQWIEREYIESFFPKGKMPSMNGKYLPDTSLLNFVKEKHKQNKVIQRNPYPYGIPQGLPISGVLANISMLSFDKVLFEYAQNHNGIYRRYSDDILLIVDLEFMEEAGNMVINELNNIGLKANDSKTEINIFKSDINGDLKCYTSNGVLSHLQYLGIEFDGLNFFIRSQSISRYYRNIKRSIARAAHTLKKYKGKILKHRIFYKKFTGINQKTENQNFFTYTVRCHDFFKPYSKIDKQITNKKIVKLIKDEVSKKMMI